MQLSQREAERQERRATNLIWNSARDYSLAPAVRAYDTDGFADIYMNSIIGAVYKYYDFPKIKEVLDSFARTPKGDEFEELAWVALENCACERAASERPALRELRLAYAQRIEAEAQRKGGARELDEAYRIKLEHYERALGMEPEMPERDRKILNAPLCPGAGASSASGGRTCPSPGSCSRRAASSPAAPPCAGSSGPAAPS